MTWSLVVHIAGGALGIVSGYVALAAAKGGRLHRASGRLFVYAMLVATIAGAMIAGFRNVAPAANVPAGMLSAYLVITALATVHPPRGWSRRVDVGLMLVALSFALTNLGFGVAALVGTFGQRWMRFPFFVFGTVGLLAALGDFRMIRAGGIRGTPRLVRHLWRMCFALFVAAGSFFLGQAKVLPPAMRIYPLLAIPPVVALLAIGWWLWRLRGRRSTRGIVVEVAREAA